MNLRDINMNLLLALDVLLQERHVTRAGKRLGLSQPAMSGALRQLRELFGDELLVRDAGSLRLTPRAQALQGPLTETLTRLGSLLDDGIPFDPSRDDAEVRIRASDYVAFLFGERLFSRLAREAPSMTIRMITEEGMRVGRGLLEGRYDLAIGAFHTTDASLRWQELMRDTLVCILRQGHPALERAVGGRILAEDLAAHPTVHVAIYRRNGSLAEDLLDMRGGATYTVPSHVCAPHLIGESDLIVLGSAAIAARIAPTLGLATLAPPRETLEVPVAMGWHARDDDSGRSKWLRKLISETIV